MIPVQLLHPRATTEMAGLIPAWLNPLDPRSAKDQLDANYKHGGGWRPFKGFTLKANDAIAYPGDPDLPPILQMTLRNERIVMYPHAWVAIIQPDRSYEICRMD